MTEAYPMVAAMAMSPASTGATGAHRRAPARTGATCALTGPARSLGEEWRGEGPAATYICGRARPLCGPCRLQRERREPRELALAGDGSPPPERCPVPFHGRGPERPRGSE